MKIFTVILIGILFLGCSHQTSIKPGTYTYVRFSNVQLGYLFLTKGVKSYFVGSEIVLNKDSTFKYTTCGNIMTGTWNYFNDSLFLKITRNRWRIDSLDKYGFYGTWPTIPIKPIGFKFDKDYLVKIHILKSGKKVIEKLKFKVP
ncbi:MAG: hypothetical protein ABSE72_09535 [Bacteroidales bacterium]|jgi:hypothetical protein